jgi:hypothetical protein
VKESNKASEKIFITTTYVAMSADIKDPRLQAQIGEFVSHTVLL